MKEITRKEVIEKEVKIYIAEDGTEFKTYRDCVAYEIDCKRKEKVAKVKHLKIYELDDTMPINTTSYPNESYNFDWYHVRDREDIDDLSAIYKEDFDYPKNYPTIVCIEHIDNEAYIYYLDNMIEDTKDFWKLLGYEVEFK